jgi:hypothetical protein
LDTAQAHLASTARTDGPFQSPKLGAIFSVCLHAAHCRAAAVATGGDPAGAAVIDMGASSGERQGAPEAGDGAPGIRGGSTEARGPAGLAVAGAGILKPLTLHGACLERTLLVECRAPTLLAGGPDGAARCVVLPCCAQGKTESDVTLDKRLKQVPLLRVLCAMVADAKWVAKAAWPLKHGVVSAMQTSLTGVRIQRCELVPAR